MSSVENCLFEQCLTHCCHFCICGEEMATNDCNDLNSNRSGYLKDDCNNACLAKERGCKCSCDDNCLAKEHDCICKNYVEKCKAFSHYCICKTNGLCKA